MVLEAHAQISTYDLINVTSYITYILYKIVVSCITQSVTRSWAKLMMAQHLEAIHHIYIALYKFNCNGANLDMGKGTRENISYILIDW